MSLPGDGKILELDIGGYAQHCRCTECFRIVHSKVTDFMSCELYLSYSNDNNKRKPHETNPEVEKEEEEKGEASRTLL